MNEESSEGSGTLEAMRRREDELLALLPNDGTAVGNTYLRRKLKMSESDYWDLRDSLVSRKVLGVGRGRGGSTFKVVRARDAQTLESRVGLESLPERTKGTTDDELPTNPGDESIESLSNTRPTIARITVENFKRIREVSIDLPPVTILVGGNNAGKSSFLQAIHTAVSCAQESERQGQKVVSEANLRFAPTHEFALLGHGAPYETRRNGSRGRVTFSGAMPNDPDVSASYKIEMYKGANHKSVGVDRYGDVNQFGKIISDPHNLFSIYVPGLSGVLLNEETHGYPSLFMRAARGDANLVFRNIIGRLLLDNKGPKLEEFLSEIFGRRVELRLYSNPDVDLHVDVRMAHADSPLESDFRPVELWGMGMLQVTQLLAYALLFEPDLLLVDEPDSHVHPSGQKLLIAALDRIANEMRCRVILSTHSRHIVAARPASSALVWMKDGEAVADAPVDTITELMEIGALDKFDLAADIVFFTEDEDTAMLEAALSNLDLDRRIDVYSVRGVNKSVMAEAFGVIASRVSHGPKVVFHRDRDCLTESEVREWAKAIESAGVSVFVPKLCDIESYFATASHLASVTGMTIGEASKFRSNVLDQHIDELRLKFKNKRITANQLFWGEGGGPTNDSLWPADEIPKDEFIYGKAFLGNLRRALRSDSRLRSFERALVGKPSQEFAQELRTFIEGL